MVAFRILGSLEVAEDGRVADLGPPKQRALLAILLLHANAIVPVDRLIDLLWPGGPPRHAAHAIQVYVSELRRVLAPFAGGDVIEWQPPGYVLRLDADALDANLVERLVGEGTYQVELGDLAAADAVLGRARELWRGPPLADFVYDEFAQDDIRHLTDVWLEGTEVLAEVKLGLGDAAEVLSLAAAAIREDPLRERPRELRLLALYRCGRSAEALRSYEDYRRLLAEELDAEPSPRLITRYDTGYSTMLEEFTRDALAPGERRFGLADGVFDIATSGHFIAEIEPVLDTVRDQVVAGQIDVPRYPSDRGPPH